jgi:hypothetical protein
LALDELILLSGSSKSSKTTPAIIIIKIAYNLQLHTNILILKAILKRKVGILRKKPKETNLVV